ncbi:MAG: hypothetical protein GWN99_07165 [Gemmatimonadetes bacterium]|uniref:Uncharacterized protein n=1 Tax=Candidatus Kutchimonas denitrificans TaxID=3056748 RepID=A0AAE4Z7J1_9BACT|nr:hypothetical protein [Gemmatimonadota bacterium]NIR74443.1 hypothetical protein [Candidatus Kutchimonas denitrificans]NIS00839.1 hypothetical protein [Gemmatimonadota bacterium]NIT66462.1 hypothetical protein [Gemmatimonadota bacterium]NIU52093.1 hypothetical protein [Gemmatimonadota bacterium]
MCEEKIMRCPHCHNVGPWVWVGFGKDWVLCQFCQRRIRWAEVMAEHLVGESEHWTPASQKTGAYH